MYTHHVDSVETESSKRKVIRVESEETQDYVCGTLAISQEEEEEKEEEKEEEEEELAFVPSHEGPFISATLSAVKKRSGTGSLPWW